MRGAFAILLVLLAVRLEAAVVVTNEKVGAGELTGARVRDMLLGRITTWPSGDAVVIVLSTSDAGERGVMEVCSRSVGLLQRGWKRLVFSGTGAMPLVTDTQQAALDLVARTPGAIMVLAEAPGDTPGVRIVPLGTPAGAVR